MANREGAKSPSKELEAAIRARIAVAIGELWAQCGVFAHGIRIEITFADGRKIGQERKFREGGA